MEPITYVIGTVVLFIAGFFSGWNSGKQSGITEGYQQGVKDALSEMDEIMRGGLSSTLDWESAQRMLQEKLWKN